MLTRLGHSKTPEKRAGESKLLRIFKRNRKSKFPAIPGGQSVAGRGGNYKELRQVHHVRNFAVSKMSWGWEKEKTWTRVPVLCSLEK